MNNITSPAIMKMNPRISSAVISILIKELMAVKNKNLSLRWVRDVSDFLPALKGEAFRPLNPHFLSSIFRECLSETEERVVNSDIVAK
jgi:hypothetical protein